MFNKFCTDICPYADEELYPRKEFCKILDFIDEDEICPVMIFCNYISKKLKFED